MTTFDDREKQFEAKFLHDQELQFKVMARRNRLLGQWAAGKVGRVVPTRVKKLAVRVESSHSAQILTLPSAQCPLTAWHCVHVQVSSSPLCPLLSSLLTRPPPTRWATASPSSW